MAFIACAKCCRYAYGMLAMWAKNFRHLTNSLSELLLNLNYIFEDVGSNSCQAIIYLPCIA